MADGKAIPYGVYDIADDSALVSVGIDHDTAQFAVAAIDAWWQQLGAPRCPNAQTLTITADCGGSNGNRTRLWKTELQRLADRTGLATTTSNGLQVYARLDESAYPDKIQISDQQLAAVNLHRHTFHQPIRRRSLRRRGESAGRLFAAIRRELAPESERRPESAIPASLQAEVQALSNGGSSSSSSSSQSSVWPRP